MGILKGTFGAQAAAGGEPTGSGKVGRVRPQVRPDAEPEGSHGRSADVEAQLRARQVDAIQRLSAPLMIVILVNVAATVSVLWNTGQLSRSVLVWSAVVCAASLYPLTLSLLDRRRPAPRTAHRKRPAGPENRPQLSGDRPHLGDPRRDLRARSHGLRQRLRLHPPD